MEMALVPKIDNATLVIGAGNYFTAPVGTALPVDLLVPGVAWDNVGNTSLEDILAISSEGGEATVLGTLQNKSLRTKYSPRTETLAFTVQQFDAASLRLYYGSNAPLNADGTIGVPSEPVPTQCAFLVVFVDGDNHFAFYAPKAEVYRNDDLSISDTESLAGLPLGVTPLQYNDNTYTYAVTPLVAEATGATSGTPGTFTPAGSQIPANLAELRAEVTASPLTAWLTGENVVLGDASIAHWDGDSWEVGAAA